MQTQEALKKRRSIREFDSRAIPRNLIESLIECAQLAPTARNIQPWEFVAITQKETLKKIGDLGENAKFIAQGPCCIAVFCQETKYYLEDGCAATENILLAAVDLGLASCWVAGDKKPYAPEIAAILGAPADLRLVSLIALGYSEVNPELPAKKPLKEVLHWELF